MSASRDTAFGTAGVSGAARTMIRRSAQSAVTALNPVLTWRPGLRDLSEVLLIALALPLYYGVRGIAHHEVSDAITRSVHIINVEKSLGIFWEIEFQSWILSYGWLVKLLNWFYLFGHLPVIGTLALWLYFWHRPQYLLMRNAFLLSGAIALIFYVTLPTAPPRLLPHELGYNFVDTVVDQYQKGRPFTPGFFVNEYAAFPSMHIGWNLLVGIAIWLASRNPFVRAFAVLMPLAMASDIILTANHYFIDAAAGFLVMLTGLGIAIAARVIVSKRIAPETATGWRGWLCWLCGVPTGQMPSSAQAV